jgi:3-phosphoshikimate 1-carboxyvinyltransferase
VLTDAVTFERGPLRGDVTVPGDKSISHRALILGAASRGPIRVTNLNSGRDVLATARALESLGARIERDAGGVNISGHTLHDPIDPLDCMNSGSTARMLMGVCAGANLRAAFDGDESLRSRPMEPVAAQLRAFGAQIETIEGHLPAHVAGTKDPATRNFILPSPSAQVKSAILFAGLFGNVPVTLTGDRRSRDHTERLLHYLGAPIEWDGRVIALHGAPSPGGAVHVANDFSAAAFFITAATITPESELLLRDVNVNPTRTGLLNALLAMGANIQLANEREQSGEPVADIRVRSAQLRATTVSPDLIPRCIDELPLLAIAAAFADGTTKIGGTRDLRDKESDRATAIERMLAAVQVLVDREPTSLVIHGGKPRASGRVIQTIGDHRIAMAAAVLATAAGPLLTEGAAAMDVSFPGFLETLRASQRR